MSLQIGGAGVARTSAVIAIMAALLVLRCPSQEHEHPASEKLGVVHFDTSCNSEAQREIDRAVALLHSFQFSRAITGFHAALQHDPECGVAWWGIALSDWSNPFALDMKDPGQLEAGKHAVEQGLAAGAKTEREKAYIAAVANLFKNYQDTSQRARLVAYRDAMQNVAAHYPEDHEAQIFYALSLAASEEPTDKTYQLRLKAGAILEKLFAQEPDHPGLAHYIIHTYDVPSLAPRALEAARRYAQIAPDAPHALHMPSHTFTRTGLWQESIESNTAAAASARREGQTGEELHASDYMMYAYLQTGQDEAARRLLLALPEIGSRFDSKIVVGGAGGPAGGYFALAAIPARYALERQDWKGALELKVRETPFSYTDAMTWFARGIGAAHSGNVAAARESVKALQQIEATLGKMREDYWAGQVRIQAVEVGAWADFADGKKQDALRQMQSAAEMEDATEKSAVTPGPLAPAREMLGEIYLQMGEPDKALHEFEETLKKEPERFRSLYGASRAAQLAGHRDSSARYSQELLKVCARADSPGRPEIQQARSGTLNP